MDADTDAAFAGDAQLDRTHIGAGSKSSGFEGEESVLVARGGVNAHFGDNATEEDPLVPRPSDDPNNNQRSNNGGWSRSTDFDGQAWYKRPSVWRIWQSSESSHQVWLTYYS